MHPGHMVSPVSALQMLSNHPGPRRLVHCMHPGRQGMGLAREENLYSQMHAALQPLNVMALFGCRPLRKQGMGHARQENLYSQMHTAMKPAMLAQGPYARRIEQGGRLVAAPPGGHSAILQMPRGNLETVRPRPLVVAAIAAALQARVT